MVIPNIVIIWIEDWKILETNILILHKIVFNADKCFNLLIVKGLLLFLVMSRLIVKNLPPEVSIH